MVERDFLYRLGRIIPEYMMDKLEAMEKTEAIAAVQSLPMGKMDEYEEAQKRAVAALKPKKAAPKKKAAKKAKKE